MVEIIGTTRIRIVDLATQSEDWTGTFAEFAEANGADVADEVRGPLAQHGEATFGGGAVPLVRIEVILPRITASAITPFGSVASAHTSSGEPFDLTSAGAYVLGAAIGAAPSPIHGVITIDGDAVPAIGCGPRDLAATIKLVNFIYRKSQPNHAAA